MAGYKKRYRKETDDYAAYVNDTDKAVFIACVNGQVAGHILLSTHWNKYAYIQDIAVDAGYRMRGVGKALIAKAKAWARERNCPGITLETQNNNVRACRFYKRCGFELRGFDTHLYRGIDSGTDEIALYWYLVLGTDHAEPAARGNAGSHRRSTA